MNIVDANQPLSEHQGNRLVVASWHPESAWPKWIGRNEIKKDNIKVVQHKKPFTINVKNTQIM
jgi:hypothetical protein